MMLIVVIEGAGWDLIKIIQAWNQQDALFKILQVMGFITLVTAFSVVWSSQIGVIIRFYEGYWNFMLAKYLVSIGKSFHKNIGNSFDSKRRMEKIAKKMKENQQKIKNNKANLEQVKNQLNSASYQPKADIKKLQKEQKQLQNEDLQLQNEQKKLNELKLEIQKNMSGYEESIYLYYPPLTVLEEEVMPTRLGNILKNAELYPLSRYKIDTVLIWPRLYSLLPQDFKQILERARSSLELMVTISALSGMFAIFSSVYLLVVKASGFLFLGCFWGGLLLAWFSYQGALGNAIVYAQQIKVAFDLYRNELLRQMLFPLPETHQEEQELWEEVCRFIYTGKI
ncbi:MAG: hypothetical protein F6K62_15675 [Sphaerospermopsis sp. SIO1G2]|nr:hypothetical protein [Sphaerospermopsis sp. SIO1G2]